MPRFWDFLDAAAETDNRAVLVLSGPIDSGESWYEDAVWPALLREELSAYSGQDILVEINSPGGDVFAGFEIYNMLLEHKGSVRVRVTGIAASAASLVAMAADPGELEMYDVSMMMIHKPWVGAMGNADKLREQADVLDMIRDVMVHAYMTRYTGGEDALRAELDKDTYLTPDAALACGLCDRILRYERDAMEEGAAAAMIGRYAAMDIGKLRSRLGVPKPAQAPEAAARDYLKEADEILAGLGMTM